MQDIAARAVALHQAGKLAQAEKLYREFLSADPNNAIGLQLLGVCLYQRGKVQDSLPVFEKSIAVDDRDPGTHINHALALAALGRLAEAKRSSECAVAANPAYPGALNSLGAALYREQDHVAAETCFQKALALKPDYAEALANLGLCRIERGDLDAAIVSLEKARTLAPDALATLAGLGNAKALKRDYTGAIETFARVVALDPKNGYARAHLYQLKRQIADWTSHVADLRALAGKDAAWSRERDLPSPFVFHMALDNPRNQLDAARLYSEKISRESVALAAVERTPGRLDAARRLKIGYLSPDFRQHPIGILIVDLLAAHDRAAFEVFAFSYGEDDGSALRTRIAGSVDHFVDIATVQTREAAETIGSHEIDILIDLAGYTTHSRPGILAMRPAPIQAHYLGFLGSMGASFVDYVLVDSVVALQADAGLFSESIVRLPHSLQVNPRREAVGPPARSRADYGLPAEGVVFCCFNNIYKFAPEMFDVWMRILGRVPGSVLWLLADSDAAMDNLRGQAKARGIDPSRIVFAGRVPYAEHLERHGHADLFLDTLPYNAGTTASDALWTGLPVLTTPGRSFASRMAASLLTALGLPELIAPDLASYEARAIRLGKDADERARLRTALAEQRGSAPLFDLDRSRRGIEAAYHAMMARWRAGLAAGSITIEP